MWVGDLEGGASNGGLGELQRQAESLASSQAAMASPGKAASLTSALNLDTRLCCRLECPPSSGQEESPPRRQSARRADGFYFPPEVSSHCRTLWSESSAAAQWFSLACGSWATPWVGTTDSDQGTAKQYHRLMAIFDNMPIGDSFKRGMVETSENHREALWSKVALVGTYESLQRANPDKRGDAWDRRCRYATVRMAQALEFRSAAQSATLLTKPLLCTTRS